MSHSSDQDIQLAPFWPTPLSSTPSPWAPSITLLGMAKLAGPQRLEQNSQLFKFRSFRIQAQFLVSVPNWLVENYAGMLDSLHEDCLALELHQFFLGYSNEDDWEDQFAYVVCEPYFGYVPCKLGQESTEYFRPAWVGDSGITP